MFDTELKTISNELKELSNSIDKQEVVVTKHASSKKLNSEYILDFIKFFVK